MRLNPLPNPTRRVFPPHPHRRVTPTFGMIPSPGGKPRPVSLTMAAPRLSLPAKVPLSKMRRQEQKQIFHRLFPMRPLLLASASAIRLQLLRSAGLDVTALPARIDEEAIRAALQAEGATPRDVADALAESKALRLANRNPDALVLGCDQVLEFRHQIFSKPDTPDAARAQLQAMRGQTHKLLSSLVLYDAGQPVWRHVGEVRLTMRPVSDSYLEEYLSRNWPGLRDAVGAYKLEEEGVRLFSKIEGDYFTVLGLPLLPLLGYLADRGMIPA